MLGGAEILLHLVLPHILREASVLHVLIHVLAHWFSPILFVEILNVHAIYSLSRVAARNLERVHVTWVHLRVVGIERPREVAHHLLADSARRLNLSLLAIFGHHQILSHIV